MTDTDPAQQKQAAGRFRPGASGNPAGRPPGVRNKVLLALDGIGGEAAEDVLRAAIAAAKNGDVAAMGMILGRLWPARRDRPVTVDIPRLETASDIVPAIAAIARAAASGELTPGEAASLSAVIGGYRAAIETAELADRIEALERQETKR